MIHQAIVVGGGLVGGLTALLLAKIGVQATVLDATTILPSQQVLQQTNPRVLAINLAAIRLMQQVEVWQNVQRHQPYSGMQVWNRDGSGEILFGSASEQMPLAQDWLGSMVEPSVLNLAIQQQLQHQIADYRPQSQVVRIEKLPHTWQISLATGEKLETHLLIGADGANSFVREQAAIQLDVLDYHETAISCAILTEQPHHHVARQIFLPTGPLALLPMHALQAQQQGYWQSLVWTLPSDLALQYAALSDAALARHVTEASHYMLGAVQQVVSRAAFPLKARHAKHYIQSGLVLLGDAAHVIHPLAGQGVNIGCLDAAVLVDCLAQDLKRGVWANLQTLQKFQHLRHVENSKMMHSMSGLGWLNKVQFKPLQWVRGEGLNIVAKQPQLINFFSLYASGMPILQRTQFA